MQKEKEKIEEKNEVKNEKGFDKKKKMIQICAIAVGLIVVFAIVLWLTRGSNLSLEDSLSKSLKNMGEEFYTEFYYAEVTRDKTTTEISEFLSKFQDVGIKVSLDNLSRYEEGKNEKEIEKFKNEKGTKCNTTSTRAIIYPKSPYGKKDYTVSVELDCGFESKTENK